MSMSTQKRPPDCDAKARFRSAQRRSDFTIDQNWSAYSPAEHNRWDRLFKRSYATLRNRACDEFLLMMEKLELSKSGIPDMEKLSSRLAKLTGWRVVPVLELVPEEIFFDHLALCRFHASLRRGRPPSAFSRPTFPSGTPILVYRRFGLMRTPNGLRIFGAGILSSVAESIFALESGSPHRLAFDIERVMRTRYIIDDFQQIYFVISRFEGLLEKCYQNFGTLYDRLETLPDIEPSDSASGDDVISKGTLEHFKISHSHSGTDGLCPAARLFGTTPG
jgi:phenylalanine-4-hydroxylase